MPPKRAIKARRNAAKKALKPAVTKKNEQISVPVIKPPQQMVKEVAFEESMYLVNLFRDKSAAAQSVVDVLVGPIYGLNSRHTDFGNLTSFHLAITMGRLDVARLLLSGYSPDISMVNYGGHNTLHCAAGATDDNNDEGLRHLVEQCGELIETVDHDGCTPLFWAIRCHHSRLALLLLELGANPSTPASIAEDLNTPLHVACTAGLLDVAKSLLANGAPVDIINIEGKTPFDLACRHEHADLIAILNTEDSRL